MPVIRVQEGPYAADAMLKRLSPRARLDLHIFLDDFELEDNLTRPYIGRIAFLSLSRIAGPITEEDLEVLAASPLADTLEYLGTSDFPRGDYPERLKRFRVNGGL